MRPVTVGGYEYNTGVARKAGPCQYGITVSGDRSSRCKVQINPGDRFIYGEMTDSSHAGGFARDRWCMAHADAEVRS